MARVLIVDDEEAIRSTLSRILKKEGYEVSTAADGEEALTVFENDQPDIVLLDIMMPKLNGFEVCEHLKGSADTRLIPVVMVTSSTATENRVRAIESGADDILGKPYERVELTARVRSLLRLKDYTDQLEQAETVVFALARSIEGKDSCTNGHCERLAHHAERLGFRLGLGEAERTALRRGGIVHDVGKVAVPDSILLKKGPLDAAEWAVMREHTITGEKICTALKAFRLVLPIIRHHHEKRDGSGYPDGLRGDDIPLLARVLQVVDVFDALTTVRPYKEALSIARSMEIMQEEVDKGWWDPAIFAEFRRLVAEEGFETPPPARVRGRLARPLSPA